MKPWIGARPRRQNAGFNPLAAANNIFGVQARPQKIFRNARANLLAHRVHCNRAGGVGAAHRLNLVVRLNHAGAFHHLLAADNFNPGLAQKIRAFGIQFVHRQPSAARLLCQFGDLLRPSLGLLFQTRAGGKIKP